jgi:hypothetical protein
MARTIYKGLLKVNVDELSTPLVVQLSGGVYPILNDKRIKIYIPKKGWGLIDKDLNYWIPLSGSYTYSSYRC